MTAPFQKVFVIAEAGVNHNGLLEHAIRLVDEAAATGADAVKFQTFRSDAVASQAAPKAEYQRRMTGEAQSQREMLAGLELDLAAHRVLFERCRTMNIEFMSSPFDEVSVDLLAREINVRRLKIPSGDLTNGPLLLKIARTGLPFVMSTGMSTLDEVEEALAVMAFGMIHEGTPSRSAFAKALTSERGRQLLAERAILLHCTTEYPAPIEEVNLRAMETMRKAFGLPVGYSDHTLGIAVPIAAVALGAVAIEKHITLDRNMRGPDHAASLEPGEFADMVRAIRSVELSLGSAEKRPTPAEMKNIPIVRRGLVALKSIKRGEPFTESNIGAKRPLNGQTPMLYWDFLDRHAPRDFAPDEPVGL